MVVWHLQETNMAAVEVAMVNPTKLARTAQG